MDAIQVVVGLGNPGPRYERTRHNAGFLVLERCLAAGGVRWRQAGDGPTLREESVARLGARDLLLVRPLAFMNRSGAPVAAMLEAHGLEPAAMLVVVDDAALPLGRLRLRAGGGSGGHNGLRSIRETLGTGDHPRLRVGVGAPPPDTDLADFVLEPLAGGAWQELERAVAAAYAAVETASREGLVAAMDVFNRDPNGGADSGPAGPGPRGDPAADGPAAAGGT